MNKKELLIPFIFVGISIAFIVITLMVFLSDGKSKKWVARKMRIGGLLLSLSFFSCGNPNPVKIEQVYGCYMIFPEGYSKFEIEIIIDSNKIIYGSMDGSQDNDYSYAIIDKKGIIRQKGQIFPKQYMSLPGKEFVIELNSKFDTCKYQFKLYDCKLKEQDSTLIFHEHEFIIKNE